MAKTATQTKTKAATKTATEGKTKKGGRAPTAYQNFMKENLKKYKAEHPDLPQTEVMKAVGALWRDAPENPNRGQEPKSRTKKAPQAKAKAKKAGDETATSEPDPAED